MNTLFLKNGCLVEFDGVLKSHIILNDLHICLLEHQRSMTDKIVSLNEKGELLWIKEINHPSILRREGDFLVLEGDSLERVNPYSGELDLRELTD